MLYMFPTLQFAFGCAEVEFWGVEVGPSLLEFFFSMALSLYFFVIFTSSNVEIASEKIKTSTFH